MAGDGSDRPLRIATMAKHERAARRVAQDLSAALGFDTEVTVYRSDDEQLQARQRLTAKQLPREWDILLYEQGSQVADGPPLEQHRAYCGVSGEWRAGPVIDEFDRRYDELVAYTAKPRLAQISDQIDAFVYDQAFVLFLYAPQALYAVNRHVGFTPYRTTFELADAGSATSTGLVADAGGVIGYSATMVAAMSPASGSGSSMLECGTQYSV